MVNENVKYALEIGPGDHPAAQAGDGYVWHTLEHPIARSVGDGLVGEWGVEATAVVDGAYDLIYAAHVLEHVPWFRTGAALAEAYRMLAPGGTIELWVPDFAYLVKCYREQKCGDEWRHENPHGDPMTWLNGRLFTYGPEPNFHKACFDDSSLYNHLRAAGFERVGRLHGHERGHRHGPISLGMKGERP